MHFPVYGSHGAAPNTTGIAELTACPAALLMFCAVASVRQKTCKGAYKACGNVGAGHESLKACMAI